MLAYGGWRVRRTANDGTQVVPDAAVLLEGPKGGTAIAFVELEFTARTPRLITRKVAPYRLLQADLGRDIVHLWLLEDGNVEQRYRRALVDEFALTAVLEVFLTGSSRGPNSVWRLDHRNGSTYRVPIALAADWVKPVYGEAE